MSHSFDEAKTSAVESRNSVFHSATVSALYKKSKNLPEKKAHITDIHEAVLGGHITQEEGEDLSSKYRPNEPAGDPKFKKTNIGRYNAMLKNRQQGKGSWGRPRTRGK